LAELATKPTTGEFSYRTGIERILKTTLKDKLYSVYLFGSRQSGNFSPTSDIDIGILAEQPVDVELSLARELLAESTIPLSIDLVDLTRAGEEFRRQVLKEGVLLWKN